jgi:hypothetical protein
VVDDKEDINRNQGGRCCLGKSSREGENRKRNIVVDKRKMATGGGENGKNIQVKKEERTYEGREDIERVLETQRGLFRGYLRSSW